MRRVVITGMGSSPRSGTTPNEVLSSLYENEIGHPRPNRALPSMASAARWPGAADTGPRHGGGSPRHALPRRRWHGVEPRRDGPGHRRCRAGARRITNDRTGIVMGKRRPSTVALIDAYEKAKGKRQFEACRPVRRAEMHELDGSATLATWFKIHGGQLFDLRRPAPRPRIASAMPMNSSSGASRTACSPAAPRSSTGRCPCCSMRWARCRPSTTNRASTASRAYDVNRDGFRDRGRGWRARVKSSRSPRRAARRSTARSSVTEPPRTATTWSLRRARAPSAACGRRSPP